MPVLRFSSIRSTSASKLVDADVEVAVGRQDHAVEPPSMKVCSRQRVGELRCPRRRWSSRRPAGGRARRGSSLVRCPASARAPRRRCRRRRRSTTRSSRAELVDQQLQRGLHAAAACPALHRAGDVDQEHQVARRRRSRLRLRSPGCRRAAAAVFGFHGARRLGRRRANGVAAIVAARVAVVEVVDQLLDAHRVRRRQLALVQEAPHVAVAAVSTSMEKVRHRMLGGAMDGLSLSLP